MEIIKKAEEFGIHRVPLQLDSHCLVCFINKQGTSSLGCDGTQRTSRSDRARFQKMQP